MGGLAGVLGSARWAQAGTKVPWSLILDPGSALDGVRRDNRTHEYSRSARHTETMRARPATAPCCVWAKHLRCATRASLTALPPAFDRHANRFAVGVQVEAVDAPAVGSVSGLIVW